MSTWIFEPGHTEVEFRARHMMVTWVRGLFKDVHGRLELDWDRCLEATFEGEIDATGIWTGEPQRDEHLRSADFFDVDNHPKITFEGRFTERTGSTTFKGEVELTIRGVTRTVPLDIVSLGGVEVAVLGRRGEQGRTAADRFRGHRQYQPPRLRRLLAGRNPRGWRRRRQRDRASPRRRGDPA